MCFGNGKCKNYRAFKFHIHSGRFARIQLINWYFVLTLLNTFWKIYWNKWYLIWKSQYSDNRIRNEIGNDIIRGCMRLEIEWLDLYGTPCIVSIIQNTSSLFFAPVFKYRHCCECSQCLRTLSNTSKALDSRPIRFDLHNQ
jgi:hypothetical protein